jgi:hypothetical protein
MNALLAQGLVLAAAYGNTLTGAHRYHSAAAPAAS